jgi:hypothetical protein
VPAPTLLAALSEADSNSFEAWLFLEGRANEYDMSIFF